LGRFVPPSVDPPSPPIPAYDDTFSRFGRTSKMAMLVYLNLGLV